MADIRRIKFGAVLIVLLLAVSARAEAATAATADPSSAPQTGQFVIDGAPVDMDLYNQVQTRWGPGTGPEPFPGKGTDGAHPETPDARTTMDAWVSPKYKPDGSWGLLVLMGWSDGPGIPGGYPDVCERHRLLLVSPRNNGNEHYRTWRVAHAVIAYREMAQRYKFNPDRLYLTGGSGGGRASSLAAFLYSDVFTGALCNCGVDCLQINGQPPGDEDVFGTLPKYAQLAHDRSRFYLFTGSGDPGNLETKQIYDIMVQRTFKHVTYFLQDGAGHGQMSNENFEKGLLTLDAPLEPKAAIKLKLGTNLSKHGPSCQAILALEQAIAIAPGTDSANKSQSKLTELLAGYQKDLADVKTIVDAGNRSKSFTAVEKFSHTYWPYDKDDVAALRREMEAAK